MVVRGGRSWSTSRTLEQLAEDWRRACVVVGYWWCIDVFV